MVEALLDQGADPDAKTVAGSSAADIARNNEALAGTDALRRLNR